MLGLLLWANICLYSQSESCVHIHITLSSMSPVGIGLCQGFPLALLLFMIFVDRVSRCSHCEEKILFEKLTSASLVQQMTWFNCLLWSVASSKHGADLSLLLLHVERGQLRRFGYLFMMPPCDFPFGGFPGTINWKETPKQTKNSLEGVYISSWLGITWDPPGEAEKHYWREGHGIPN